MEEIGICEEILASRDTLAAHLEMNSWGKKPFDLYLNLNVF